MKRRKIEKKLEHFQAPKNFDSESKKKGDSTIAESVESGEILSSSSE